MHSRLTTGSKRWTAADADRWLAERAPLGMHFGLERMVALMDCLGRPHERFRSVHVVGTNGKSSTVRMIAALLERHGVRTGAYLSPHLVSFTERIEIGERSVEPRRFAAAVHRVAAAVDHVDASRSPADRVTQFEALTAAAYVELAARGVEVAVVEAGLGGRYDATSVISSSVQVLTNVGLDHTQLLGPSHGAIAAEKLAIVPPRGRLVVGAGLHPEADRVAIAVAAQRDARVLRAAADPSAELGLSGAFQRRNFGLAEAAASALLGAPLRPDAVRDAAAAVRSPGRLEILDRAPLTVVDAAHNPDGIGALMDCVPELRSAHGVRGRLIAVVSILADKDAPRMLEALLAHGAVLVLTSNSSPRAYTAEELALIVNDLGGPIAAMVDDPVAALRDARRLAGPSGMVLVTGSICLIGDVLSTIKPRRPESELPLAAATAA